MKGLVYWLLLLGLSTLFLTSFVSAEAEDVAPGVTAETVELDADDLDVIDEDEDDDFDASEDDYAEEFDDDNVYYDDDENDGVLRGSRDVTISYFFPDYPDQKLEIGEPVSLLLAMSNNGDNTFNVSGVQAHLHSVFDYTYYIQNFSRAQPGFILEPHSQVSLEYMFMPHHKLEPLDFWFSAYVDYTDMDTWYRSTFVNGTIEVVEKAVTFNLEVISTYFISLGALLTLIYIGLSVTGGLKKIQKSTARSSGARSQEQNNDDWGTVYKQKKSGKSSKKQQ